MWWLFGLKVRQMGRVHSFAGSGVVTEFVVLHNVLPLLPLRSWLVVDWGEKRLPTRLCWRSVLATYGLYWGGGAAVILGFTALKRWDRDVEDWWGFAVVAAVLALGAVLASRQSKPDLALERLRNVYARESGQPFDPAMLPSYDASVLRERLVLHVVDAARRLPAGGYRAARVGEEAWMETATTSGAEDVPFLQAALTLCRLEMGIASGRGARGRFARLHRSMWSNLKPRLSGREPLFVAEDAADPVVDEAQPSETEPGPRS